MATSSRWLSPWLPRYRASKTSPFRFRRANDGDGVQVHAVADGSHVADAARTESCGESVRHGDHKVGAVLDEVHHMFNDAFDAALDQPGVAGKVRPRVPHFHDQRHAGAALARTYPAAKDGSPGAVTMTTSGLRTMNPAGMDNAAEKHWSSSRAARELPWRRYGTRRIFSVNWPF